MEPCVVVYLSERGHGQERIVGDGVISEVWRRLQGLNRAHLSFGTTEQTSRVTGAHPHHSSRNRYRQLNHHGQMFFIFILVHLELKTSGIKHTPFSHEQRYRLRPF